MDSNPRQTFTPMLVEFLKDYGARIQLGVQMDRYKTERQYESIQQQSVYSSATDGSEINSDFQYHSNKKTHL
jgi:hypothetical protein